MGLENPLHIAIILMVVLMVFGAKRLPEMGKGLGEGMRGFKQAITGDSPPHVHDETPATIAPAPLALTKVEEPAADREPAQVA
jgi:sec-independent protein translocase protein TatA